MYEIDKMDANRATSVKSFHGFAIGVLAFNLLIILGGALVRVTGSGAGCGQHWPWCDGEIIPGLATIHQRIEFSHRVLVGAGIAAVFLLWWKSKSLFEKKHLARKAALWSGIFTFTESLVGAGLVLLKLVGTDASISRSVAISGHLLNTLLLIGVLAICVYASGNRSIESFEIRDLTGKAVIACLIAISLVAATGALTALGDTLYPASHVSEIAQPVSVAAHFLKKLRIIHPFMAMTSGGLCLLTSMMAYAKATTDEVKSLSYIVGILVIFQVALGFANLLLLAPLTLQLAHLLIADALWIALIFLAASVTGVINSVDNSISNLSVPLSSELAGGVS